MARALDRRVGRARRRRARAQRGRRPARPSSASRSGRASRSSSWPLTLLPLTPRGTLRAARGLPTDIALRALAFAAFSGAEVYLPRLLTERDGLSPSLAGVALTITGVTWFVGSWVQGRWDRRFEIGRTAAVSLGAITLTLLGLAAAVALVAPAWVVIALFPAVGLGIGTLYPRVTAQALGRVRGHGEQGFVSSALQIGDSSGAATAIALSAIVFAAPAPPSLVRMSRSSPSWPCPRSSAGSSPPGSAERTAARRLSGHRGGAVRPVRDLGPCRRGVERTYLRSHDPHLERHPTGRDVRAALPLPADDTGRAQHGFGVHMSNLQTLLVPADESTVNMSAMSIRELIGALSPPRPFASPAHFVPMGGRLVTNPERRLLLRHQRLVIASLRRRRATLRLPVAGS